MCVRVLGATVITSAEYKKRSAREWQAAKVRTRRALSNRNMVIPVGTVVTITEKYSGFSIAGAPCPCCGVQVRVTRVSPGDLEEFDDEHDTEADL